MGDPKKDIASTPEDPKQKKWAELEHCVRRFIARAKRNYGSSFQFSPFVKSVPNQSYSMDAPRKGLGMWEVKVDRNIYLYPQVSGTVNGKTGDYIITETGHLYLLETVSEWGPGKLRKDTVLSAVSEPDQARQKIPFIKGISDQVRARLPLSNYNKKNQDQGLYGLGTIENLGGKQVKIEYSFVSNDSIHLEENLNLVRTTLASE